jgi:putative copper export protein
MRLVDWLKWAHLLGAAVWTGGLITLAALIPVLRRRGVPREVLQAVARRFGTLSWSALGVLVATGIWQVQEIRLRWSYGRLVLKLWLVGAVAALALVHQVTARRMSPAGRGAIQGVILVLSVAIFGAAARLL